MKNFYRIKTTAFSTICIVIVKKRSNERSLTACRIRKPKDMICFFELTTHSHFKVTESASSSLLFIRIRP